MLISNLFGERLRSKPAEATLISHVFLLRGGYIRNVGSGIYSLLTPAVRVQNKLEKIIREEMEKIRGQEVSLPVVVPADLWKQSGRFESVGSELLRLKDRSDRDMVLSMTHEEPAVYLAKTEAKSYLGYPFMIYQIQTKFRDEPRARGGLIRVREFKMKDAYSFHTSQEDLEKYYNEVYEAYVRIFERAGLKNVVAICSDTGMMGGNKAHEFMLLSECGEDSIILCDKCGYKANMEVAVSELDKEDSAEEQLKKVHTPGLKTIDEVAEFFNTEARKVIKAIAFDVGGADKPLIVFIRGDLQVNEAKLKNHIKHNVKELNNLSQFGLIEGFIGPNPSLMEKCNVIFDNSLKNEVNMICGANDKDYHYSGFSMCRDININEFCDVSKVKNGQKCKFCGGDLRIERGIEVGNIFQLGTKYTESMEMTYVDQDGKVKTPIMGCYGIGIGRLLACMVEESHDDFGPIWPKNVAPWQIHICALNAKSNEVREKSEELYEELSKSYEVIFDNRNLSAGAQFADADLLGVPVRIVVSKRNIANNQFEVVLRSTRESKLMNYEELRQFLKEFYN